MDDLRSGFPRHEVTAVLQCAGHRRAELMAVADIPGELPWRAEAIGNGAWAGARLGDVVREAGVRPGAGHVGFVGLDRITSHGGPFGFGGSVPLDKALAEEVLLAYEVDGQALAPVHGFPVRALVPGYIGARSVKWLGEIEVRAEPSDNYYQARSYKLFPPEVTAETVDWSAGRMLGPLDLDAVIWRPAGDGPVPAGTLAVEGYGVAGRPDALDRVEVSADGGGTWVRATWLDGPAAWAWRRWSAEVALLPGRRQLVARAFDREGAGQPEQVAALWNFKGYGNHAWHRVDVEVV